MDYSVTVKGIVLPVSVSLKKMKQVRLKGVSFWRNKVVCSGRNTIGLDH